MFSPTTQSARQNILKSVLELPEELVGDALSNESFAGVERDENIALDPELLAGADCAAFYDLEELEESYQSYMSKELDISTLSFLADAVVDASFVPDSVSIMTLLVPAHHATQKLAHKLRGLNSISLQLNGIECGHPSLVAQRDLLIYAVNLDAQSLVRGAWDRYLSKGDLHSSVIECGLRIVDAGV
ncbi:Transposase family Tnp2 protein [Ceratobasidium sp. AG-Ba]|nr:Transposase family Tnp2 protein [Ceratobasidium sp. AG-Ba]QRW11171.1 Transposase family Tnp2 protein [Ceratobasidium sp. AG-Ba]